MTMMNGLDLRELNILDEDYYGPPPRFLLEPRPSELEAAGVAPEEECEAAHVFQKLKTLFGMN